jgi:hypothetical protein
MCFLLDVMLSSRAVPQRSGRVWEDLRLGCNGECRDNRQSCPETSLF